MSNKKSNKGRRLNRIVLEDRFPHGGYMQAMQFIADTAEENLRAEGNLDGVIDLTNPYEVMGNGDTVPEPRYTPIFRELETLGYLTADGYLTDKGKRLVVQLIEMRHMGGVFDLEYNLQAA